LFFPVFAVNYFGFFQYWLGRGFFFLFFGALMLSYGIGGLTLTLITAIVLIIVGCIYFIIHFITQVPRPQPFRSRSENQKQTTTA